MKFETGDLIKFKSGKKPIYKIIKVGSDKYKLKILNGGKNDYATNTSHTKYFTYNTIMEFGTLFIKNTKPLLFDKDGYVIKEVNLK